jgi:23S rRNA (cytosine1962-C5)-methyltransferase
VAGRLKREGALFDCVFVDPPFFSTTIKGTVDLSADPRKLIDKVRPLVAHQGLLVVVNNALFLPGKDFEASLREVCADGYATLERTFEVPSDVTGYAATRVGTPPVDPAPFNHPTKMALLKLTRKDGRTEALPKVPKQPKAKKAAAVVDDEDDSPEFPR